MASLKVYGVPLSQPVRSVVWALLQKQEVFQFQISVPGANSRIGSRNEGFLAKTKGRTGVVPVLEDGLVCISECPAILSYLCETRPSLSDLYAKSGTPEKAYIDSYMHWHHTNTRMLSKIVRPHLRPELKSSQEDEELARSVLQSLDEGWLKDSPYVATENYSIADILAYEEVVQVTGAGLLDLTILYPNVAAWVARMEKKPYHEEAHVAVKTLGSLTEANETPMQKRLGAATKAGMKAIQEAQDSYNSQSKL